MNAQEIANRDISEMKDLRFIQKHLGVQDSKYV
jgi:hypothetical protein